MRKHALTWLIVSLVAAAALLGGCGGGSQEDANDPGQVVKKFWSEAFAKNVDATWDMLAEKTRAGFKTKEEWKSRVLDKSPGAGATVEVTKVKTEGDNATVSFAIKRGGRTTASGESQLVKENGAWKVAMP